VSYEEGKNWADENGFSFIETSALNGFNCNNIRELLAQELRKQLTFPDEAPLPQTEETSEQPEDLDGIDTLLISSPTQTKYIVKRNGIYVAKIRMPKNNKLVQVRVAVREHRHKFYTIIQTVPAESSWRLPTAFKHEIKLMKSVTFIKQHFSHFVDIL
jgi:hypothetical protein